MYKIVGSNKDRSLRVIWMMEELGEPYTLVPAFPRSDEAKEHNPTGKVPALIVDGQVFTDSVAIMTYLGDKHGKLTFAAGTVERLTQDGHTNFLLEEFDGVLWTVSKHRFVNPEEHRVEGIKPALSWEFDRGLARLEERLGDGPYLMGDVITIPDLLAVHCLNWGFAAKFSRPSAKLLAYSKAIRSRPAFQRASEVM